MDRRRPIGRDPLDQPGTPALTRAAVAVLHREETAEHTEAEKKRRRRRHAIEEIPLAFFVDEPKDERCVTSPGLAVIPDNLVRPGVVILACRALVSGVDRDQTAEVLEPRRTSLKSRVSSPARGSAASAIGFWAQSTG
jgi:hypothetical protein